MNHLQYGVIFVCVFSDSWGQKRMHIVNTHSYKGYDSLGKQ